MRKAIRMRSWCGLMSQKETKPNITRPANAQCSCFAGSGRLGFPSFLPFTSAPSAQFMHPESSGQHWEGIIPFSVCSTWLLLFLLLRTCQSPAKGYRARSLQKLLDLLAQSDVINFGRSRSGRKPAGVLRCGISSASLNEMAIRRHRFWLH